MPKNDGYLPNPQNCDGVFENPITIWLANRPSKVDGVSTSKIEFANWKLTGFALQIEFANWKLTGFALQISSAPTFPAKGPVGPHLIILQHDLGGDSVAQQRPNVVPQASCIHQLPVAVQVHLGRFLAGHGLKNGKSSKSKKKSEG